MLEDSSEWSKIFQGELNRVTTNTVVCLAILPQIQVLAVTFNRCTMLSRARVLQSPCRWTMSFSWDHCDCHPRWSIAHSTGSIVFVNSWEWPTVWLILHSIHIAVTLNSGLIAEISLGQTVVVIMHKVYYIITRKYSTGNSTLCTLQYRLCLSLWESIVCGCGLEADIALGFTLCYNSLSTTPLCTISSSALVAVL